VKSNPDDQNPQHIAAADSTATLKLVTTLIALTSNGPPSEQCGEAELPSTVFELAG